MKFNLKKINGIPYIEMSGFIGIIIMTLSLAISIPLFRGLNNELFNPFDHFISELGVTNIKSYYLIFNISLVIVGILFVFFMIHLSQIINSKLSHVAGFFGVLSALSCSYMGLFSMDKLIFHFIGAYIFFYCGMFSVLFYGLAIYFDKKNIISKLYSSVYFISFAIHVSFLFFIEEIPKQQNLTDFVFYRKSPVWLPALLEWFVVSSVGFCIITISFWYIKKNKTTKSCS